MAIIQLPFPLFQPALILSLVPALIVLVHFLTWLVDPHGLRSFPGPWLARFSDLWLGRVAQQGHRSEVVHEMHKKYGEPAEMSLQAPTKQCAQEYSSVSHQTTSLFPIPRPSKSFTPTAVAL